MSEFVNARLGGYRVVFSLLRCVCLTILGWCLGRVMVGVGGLRISAHDLTVSTKFDDGIVQKKCISHVCRILTESSLACFHAFSVPSNQPIVENMM